MWPGQYLSGEALRVVENLDHSTAAYLYKYEGRRGQIALYLDELGDWKAIRVGNAKYTEKLVDIQDIEVINRKEAGRHKELGNGSLYDKLQRKMT